MMTEENIKEAISIRFIEAVVNYKGYKTVSVHPDHGTDVSIVEVDYRIEDEQKRYFDTGREIKVQLKSTTVSSIIWEDTQLKYDLESKTYNDLITRKNNYRPLLLILFVLPENIDNWILLTAEELAIRKQAYWYFPEATTFTENVRTIRITIPKTNLFAANTIDNLFETFT